MEKVKVYIAGVDDWNRPTFCTIDRKRFYCDVTNLFGYGASDEEIIEFYKRNGTANIVYKGRSFDSEPEGDSCCVEIITREEAKKLRKENRQ